MKLVTFQTEDGIRHGILRGNRTTAPSSTSTGRLLGLIEAGGGVGAGQNTAPRRASTHALRPPTTFALARSTRTYITEAAVSRVDKQRVVLQTLLEAVERIIIFNAALCLPSVSSTTDWEVELAVVIGARCRDVAVERTDVVFGYTIANVSSRTTDWGVSATRRMEPFFDWLSGKWPDGFTRSVRTS
jgi:2-keto-4-pentenoate hydratase/2-oxohepta-3-ene-1,7-dioic acid hydratase in catechol pathway